MQRSKVDFPQPEEPSIYERYCVNAYNRVVKFFQLRLGMDRYDQIYRKLGKIPPRVTEQALGEP